MKSRYLLYTIIVLASISCQKDPNIPVFTGKEIGDDIATTYTTAQVNASFADAKSSYVYRMIYSDKEDLSSPSELILTESQGYQVGALSNLIAGKTYYYKYSVSGVVNAYYTEDIKSFTTTAYHAAKINTQSIRSVAYESVSVSATLSDWGCEVMPEWGICYGTSTQPVHDGQKMVASQDGLQWFNLSSLLDGTTYYVRSFANSKYGLTYGNELTFTTRKYVIPTVETHTVIMSGQVAICNAMVTYDGGKNVTEKGICYSISADPTIDDSKVVSLTTGAGAYSCLLKDLDSKTKYYIRAYAVNEKGVGYGELKSFTTE